MSPQADRNLLFGILALQLNFVDREALIAAMRDWVEDKSQPLGSIFVARGDLADEERVVVEMAVQRHLARHAGDPVQSLAAMSVDSGLRESIVAIADRADVTVARSDTPSPQATLANVLGTLPPDKRDARPADGAAEVKSRFTIVRPHARGGLGAVYVAVDEELHREVALKEIQPKYAGDEDARQRFILEAKVTGGLEHPGIVPVYGFGAYGDGRPYYAMRFIRGESLHKQIEAFHAADRAGNRDPGERQLALRKLLRSFVDVCNAIQYAHSRGVLHRDLKPDNVMLGAYGETLVVDWGLAKLVDRTDEQRQASAEASLAPSSHGSDSQTQVGRAVGTPMFMSPEQALGWHDTLTAATDVYSLGATLYMLLVGSAPVKASSVAEVLLKVQTGAIVPPRDANPDLPAPLEAIILKAMHRQPSDRYATPRKLADDVEAWLADEPVSAYPEPWTTTAQRWVTRHLALVSGVGATLLVGVVSLTIGVFLLSAANERESNARGIAEENLKKAESNFKLARSVVDEYLVKVSDDPRLKAKGLEQLRHSLLETARKFFDKFGNQAQNDPDLKFEQAQALIRLASSTNDIGSKRQAVGDCQAALKMIDELVAARGWRPEYAAAAARGRIELATVEGMLGDTNQAVEAVQTIYKVDAELGAARPVEFDYRRQLAQGWELLGKEYHNQADAVRARAAYVKAIQLKRQLAEESPQRGDLWMSLANVHGTLGLLEEDLGDPLAGEVLHREKVALTEKARDLGFDSPEVPTSLVESYLNLSTAEANRGRYDEAERFLRKGLTLSEELCRDHPLVLYYDYCRVHALMRRVELYVLQGKVELARAPQEEAQKIVSALLRDNSEVHALTSLLITCHDRMASFELAAGRFEDAEREMNTAIKLAADEAARLPDIPARAKEHAFMLIEMAFVQAEAAEDEEDFKKVEQLFAEALAIIDRLCEQHPKWLGFAQYRVGTLITFGIKYVEMEMYDQARAQYDRAVARLDELETQFPDNLGLRRYRAEAYRRMAEMELNRDEGEPAAKHFDAAAEILRPLVSKYPQIPAVQFELASICQFQANVALNLLNDLDAAKKALAEADPLATDLQANQPGIPGYDNLLGRVRYFQARVAVADKRPDDALRLSQQSLDLLRPLLKLENEDAILYVPLCHSMRAAVYYDQGKYDLELAERDALLNVPLLPDPLSVQLDRALCLIRLLRLEEAMKQLEEVVPEVDNGHLWYIRGCYTVIAAAVAKNDMRVAEEVREKRFTDWRAKALLSFDKAKAAGYFTTEFGVGMLRADVTQAPEPVRDIFRKLLEEVEPKP